MTNDQFESVVEELISIKKEIVKSNDFLKEKIEAAPFLNPFNPHAYLSFKALEESCELISAHMEHAMVFRANRPEDLYAVLLHALEQPLIDGLVLEFGVYSGKSINLISERLPNRRIFGFDSFEGLPTEWAGRHVKQGHFKKVELPEVNDNVHLIKGWFDDTLPIFVDANEEQPVSFLHIDCDLYSSTKTVFDNLRKRIVPGTIIVFDEYMNYTTWRHHEHRAFMELCESENIEFTYLAFGLQQASVRIDKIGRKDKCPSAK